MKPHELLFWIIVGISISILLFLFANQVIANMLQITVNVNPSGVSSGGGGGGGGEGVTCSDSTPYSQCSSNKPEYCDNNGNLLNNYCYGPDKVVGTADDCGCPSESCQSDGSCAAPTCDSTCKAQSFSSGTCEAGSSTPSGMLHACGTNLCDENNNVVRLKCTQITWNDWARGYFSQDDVNRMKQAGANCLEINGIMLTDLTNPDGSVNIGYLDNYVSTWVSWCTQAKMYCILTPYWLAAPLDRVWSNPDWLWTKGGYSQPTTEQDWVNVISEFFDVTRTRQDAARVIFTNMWATIASKYKDNPYVIYGLMNEPLNWVTTTAYHDGLTLPNAPTFDASEKILGQGYSKFFGNVVDSIRNTGSSQIISVDWLFVGYYGGWDLSYNYDLVGNNITNIMWESHHYVEPSRNYSQWKNDVQTLYNKFVTGFGRPFYVGEYGFDPPNTIRDYSDWRTILQNMVTYLDNTIHVAGRSFFEWGYTPGEYFNSYSGWTQSESDFIIQTVLGGSTTTNTNTNLAPIPDGWTLNQFSNEKYPDNNVLHSGHPSIRLEPSVGSENPWREIDPKGVAPAPYQDFQVKTGDRVVFKCWMYIWNNNPTIDSRVETFSGARIGLDLNGVTTIGGILARVNSGLSPTASNEDANYVHWGTVGWVQRTIDYIVPSTTFTHDWYRNVDISPTHITQIGPWMQVWGPDGPFEVGNAWFSDCELYINPTPTGSCQSDETPNSNGNYECSGLCCCSGTAQTCSSLTYPSDRWQRVWYTHSTNVCLGNGPDETSTTFDDNWASGTVAYQADDIQFNSSRTINFATAGTYTFTLGSDDGARLWIDDVLRIDKWIDRSYTTDSVTLSLAVGNHRFRIDYYENGGAARVSFNYSQVVASQNLAVIPDNCEQYLQQGRIENGPDPQIVFLDTSVTYNGKPSIRCDGPATSVHPYREVDFYNYVNGHYSLYAVKPGDHIVFKIWMKTQSSTLSNPTFGATFGFDLWGPSGRLWECGWGFPATTNFDYSNGGNDYVWSAYKYLPFGTSGWTQGIIDGYIPTKTFTQNDGYSGGSTSIPAQQVDAIIPWILVQPKYPSPEGATVWFAGAELYINP